MAGRSLKARLAHVPGRDWRSGRKLSPTVREDEHAEDAEVIEHAEDTEDIEPLQCNGKQREHLGGVTAGSVMEKALRQVTFTALLPSINVVVEESTKLVTGEDSSLFDEDADLADLEPPEAAAAAGSLQPAAAPTATKSTAGASGVSSLSTGSGRGVAATQLQQRRRGQQQPISKLIGRAEEKQPEAAAVSTPHQLEL